MLMKSLLSTAATLSLAALLAACGSSASDAATPPPAPEAAEPTAAPAATPAATETDAVPEATITPAAAPAAEPSAEFAALPAPYNEADYASGKRTFKLCVSCHLTAEGAGNLVGPNLHGVFGREAGSVEGFAYSDALANADFTWTPEHLDAWLANPRTYLPGNRMSFAGVRKPEDRTALIAYLMLETGYTPASE